VHCVLLHTKQADNDVSNFLGFIRIHTVARWVRRFLIGVNALSAGELLRLHIPATCQTVLRTRCSYCITHTRKHSCIYRPTTTIYTAL